MITVRLDSGQILTFPDDTPEEAIHAAAQHVMSGQADRQASVTGNPDFSDVENGTTEARTRKREQMRDAWKSGDLGHVPEPDTSAATIAADTLGVTGAVAANANVNTARLPSVLGGLAARGLERATQPLRDVAKTQNDVDAESRLAVARRLMDAGMSPGSGLASMELKRATDPAPGTPDSLAGPAAMAQGWQDAATQRLGTSSQDLPTPVAAAINWGADTAGIAADAGQWLLGGGHTPDAEALRLAAIESRGGARELEGVPGLVTREYGRGSAPSEIAQAKIARSGDFLPGAHEPLIYRDTPDDPAHGSIGWKGKIPDTLRRITGKPWREYGGDVPLEEPTSVPPKPRSVDRAPLPTPPIDPGMWGGDTEVARIGGLFDYASRRYPTLSSMVKRIKINERGFGGYYEPETGTLALPDNADLGTMMHEYGHIAQHARGQLDDLIAARESGDIQANFSQSARGPEIEAHPTRLGDVYGRMPQPQSSRIGRENLIPGVYDMGRDSGPFSVSEINHEGWGILQIKPEYGGGYELHAPGVPVRSFRGDVGGVGAEDRAIEEYTNDYLAAHPKLQRFEHQGRPYFGQPGDLPPADVLRATFPKTEKEIAESTRLRETGQKLREIIQEDLRRQYEAGEKTIPPADQLGEGPLRLPAASTTGPGTVRPLPDVVPDGPVIGDIPLTDREFSAAMADHSIEPSNAGYGGDSEGRAFTAWMHKNGINPDHAGRYGELPELRDKFFELHNDPGPAQNYGPLTPDEEAGIASRRAPVNRRTTPEVLSPDDDDGLYADEPGTIHRDGFVATLGEDGETYYWLTPEHQESYWEDLDSARQDEWQSELEWRQEAQGTLSHELGRPPTREEIDAEVAGMMRSAGHSEESIAEYYPAHARAGGGTALTRPPIVTPDFQTNIAAQIGGPEGQPLTADVLFHEITHTAQDLRGQLRPRSELNPEEFNRLEQYAHARGAAARDPSAPSDVPVLDLYGRRAAGMPYANTPDQLMGFSDPPGGVLTRPGKGYAEEGFSYTQPVSVKFPGQPVFEDEIKGLNQSHALERARRNWEGARIEALPGGRRLAPSEVNPFRAYVQPPVVPPMSEDETAAAMGWKLPDGSPEATKVDPIKMPGFQTNIAAQVGGPGSVGFGNPEVAGYVMQNSDEVFKAIGPPQTWNTVEDMAARSGTTPEEFLRNNPRWNVLPPEERMRLTYVIKGNDMKLQKLQAKLVDGSATDADKAEILRRIDTAGNLIKIGAKTGSEYGRALNTLKMESRIALGDDQLFKQSVYRKYAAQLDQEKPLMDSLARLDPNNPEELSAFIRSVNRPTYRQYVHEYWVNSILSSPVPFERKVIGDGIAMLTENGLVRPLAAAFDAARVKGIPYGWHAPMTLPEREVFLSEVPAAFTGLGRGIEQGFRRGMEVLRRGYDPETMTGELFIPRSAFARSQNPFVREVIGPIVTAPVRLISAATTMARTMNFTAELYAQAARAASKEIAAGTIAKSEMAGRIASLVANPTDEIVAAASKFGARTTFTDETSALGKAVIGLRDLPKATSDNPVIRGGLEAYRAGMGFMMPFVHIADRLLVRGLEYTPISAATSIGARNAGNYAEAANLAAKASIGSATMAYAASLATQGKLTASAPSNPADRAAFYAEGKQPWSVKVGDSWVPFGHMQPLAMPFALVAAVHKGWTEDGTAPDMEKLGSAAAQVGAHITDQSYLQSMHKLMDVVSGSEQNAGRAFSDIAASTAFGFVPFSGMTRTVARAVDPRMIDAKTVKDKMLQNVPGASLGMVGKLTPWGEEDIPAGGRFRGVLASGTTLLPSQETKDPLDTELGRLGVPLGFVGNTISDKQTQGGKTRLTPDEHYVYQQSAGRASKLALQSLFATPGYMELDPETQRTAVSKAVGAARKYARMTVLMYHRKQGYPGLNPAAPAAGAGADEGATP